MKPNFLVIGAARSGTTSLHKYLEQHPDIFMSAIKEINFFSNPNIRSKGNNWYFRHFRQARHKLIGEASTSYTTHPFCGDVAHSIKENLGEIKLVYILRDPIDRLLSHYLHHVHRGEIFHSFDTLLEKLEHPMFQQGLYYYQVKQYLKYFSREKIFLLTINDLQNNTMETIEELYRFLDIPIIFNKSIVDRIHNSNNLVTKKNNFGIAILDFYSKNIEQRNIPYRIKKIFLDIAEIGSSEISTPLLDSKKLRILTDYYRSDVLSLRENLAVNISSWRNYE